MQRRRRLLIWIPRPINRELPVDFIESIPATQIYCNHKINYIIH